MERVNELEASIVAHIGDNGPIGFDEYVDHALYAPGLGFYASGGGAGRRASMRRDSTTTSPMWTGLRSGR